MVSVFDRGAPPHPAELVASTAAILVGFALAAIFRVFVGSPWVFVVVTGALLWQLIVQLVRAHYYLRWKSARGRLAA